MSARELHEKLGVKTRYNDWLRYRLKQAMLTEGQDFVILKTQYATAPIECFLTLDAAKHCAMLERTATGKAIRQYFIDVEQAALAEARHSSRLQAPRSA